MDPLQAALVMGAAALGGGINSIAGGGTLVTFPAIVALGVPPLVANATSTVALWPASLGSLWGYRQDLRGSKAWALRFALPSLIGGGLGAALLLRTGPDLFERIVPFLVLLATLLFASQRALTAFIDRRKRQPTPERTAALPNPPLLFLLYQLGVSIYGGYFGAGIGILMLAALGFMGLTDIHRMNGLKNWGGLCMNAVAAILFAKSGVVDGSVALAMAVGGLAGGYGGARLARKVGREHVRTAIVFIGLSASAWLLVRSLR
ncbi:MAG: sulfite exporter TauE/SafE family protein [Deltaproteobacteria bacterium]|nr:sulfite exporter TauE/SafE family protein [Deltaproteobacteria bacterium]